MIRGAKISLAAPVVLALLVALPATARVYKWVDDDGNVVFSQQPPPGREAEVIEPRYAKQPAVPPRATPAAAQAREEAEPETPRELTPEQIAIKQQNCANARSQLAEMNSPRANRLQYVNENNELAFLTEEQRAARIRQAREAIEKYCD